MINNIFLEHTSQKSELKIKDYEDSCGDDSDKDSHWKPKTDTVFDKRNLKNVLYLNIDTF
jgi:hypothetical protein